MCGIIAISGNQAISENCLMAGLTALAARGPDGSALWLSDDQRVGLGHTRLAIRDLTGGQQPLHLRERQLSGVFNGEFYDIEPLRVALQAKGYHFQSESDSEVALTLYAEFGLDCLRYLRGEFALILWDAQRQELIALRDRFGIKPLYYAQIGEQLLLASKASALWAMGLTPDWDLDSLAQICSFQYPLPHQSLFAGIQALPPGYCLRWCAGKLEIFAYWDLDYPLAVDLRPEAEKQLIPDLVSEIQTAVALRRVGEQPVCSYLSAGLDSSLISALLNQTGKAPAFCVGFPGWEGDESKMAQVTADALGIQLHCLQLDFQRLTAAMAETVRVTEGSSINPHVVARRLLCQHIRAAGFKVVLTGEGADELFGGYAHLLEDLAPGGDRHNSLKGMHLPLGPEPDLGLLHAHWGHVPTFIRAKAALGERLRSLLSAEFCAHYPLSKMQAGLLNAFPEQNLKGRHRVHHALYLWNKLGLAGYILPTVADGAEMAEGLEGRLPFLDHVLFERVRTLPPEQLMAPGLEKALLRKLAKPWLPEDVRLRPKAPFLAPSLLSRSLQADPTAWQQVQALFFPDPLPDFVNAQALSQRMQWLAHAPPEAHQSWEPPLLLLSSLCQMMRLFFSKRSFS